MVELYYGKIFVIIVAGINRKEKMGVKFVVEFFKGSSYFKEEEIVSNYFDEEKVSDYQLVVILQLIVVVFFIEVLMIKVLVDVLLFLIVEDNVEVSVYI